MKKALKQGLGWSMERMMGMINMVKLKRTTLNKAPI